MSLKSSALENILKAIAKITEREGIEKVEQKGLEHAFSGIPAVNKSAADSAKVLAGAPDVKPVLNTINPNRQADAAAAFGGMPKSAVESAEVLAGAPDLPYPKPQLNNVINPNRQADAAHAFGQLPEVNKSAAESANVFQSQGPNFDLVGGAKNAPAPGSQNFQLQGKPYSGNVPATVQSPGAHNLNSQGGLPAVATGGAGGGGIIRSTPAGSVPGLPEQPMFGEIIDITPKSRMEKVMDFVKNNKIPIGAAATGLTSAGLLMNEDEKGGPLPHRPDLPYVLDDRNYLKGPVADQPPVPLRGTDVAYPEEQQEQPLEAASETKKAAAGTKPKAAPAAKKAEAPQSPTQELAQSMASVADDNGLQKAMDQRDLIVLANQLGKASELVGTAISGAKPTAAGMFDTNVGLAQQKVSDYKELLANEENDANSAVSKNYRDFLARYGVKAPENITAKQVKDTLLPFAFKDKEAEEARAGKLEEAKYRQAALAATREQTQAYRDAMISERRDRQARTQLEAMKNKALSGGGKPASDIRTRINGANAIFATAGVDTGIDDKGIEQLQDKELNQLPPQFIAELAIETNRMLTGSGVPAQSTFKKLLPKNIAMDQAGLEAYVTSKMTPANQASFVKQILKTAVRVRDNSKKQNAELMKQYVSGTSHIAERLPEDYDAALTELGLDPNEFNGKLKGIQLSTSEKKQTLDFAKQHGMTYEQAEKLIKSRKAGQ